MLSVILDRLKNGLPELYPPFEPRARWIYAIVGLQCTVGALLLWWMGYSLDASVWRKLPLAAVPLALSGMLARRYGHPRLGGTIEVIALTYLQGMATIFLLFPLTELSLPFADRAFAVIDESLGFDWPKLATLFAHNRMAFHLSELIYYSMEWQPLVIVPLLFITGRELRAWRFVTASAVAALVVLSVYPFMPAQGPAVHYGLLPRDFPTFGDFPWTFGPDLALIKHHELRVISLRWIFGMVSLPSYHAASAVMFAWAAWPLRKFRWLFVALNVGIAITSLYVGVHYLVDILAGLATGAAAIVVAARIVQERTPEHSLPIDATS
jgi:membrane-associated phospholipid phosphatase